MTRFGRVRLSARQSRSSAGMLVVLFAVATLASAIGVGQVSALDAAIRDGALGQLERAPASAAALRVTTSLADDAAAQSSAVDTLLGDAFGSASVDVSRTVQARALAVLGDTAGGTTSSTGGPAVVTTSDPALRDHARLVDGAWPDADTDTDTDADADADADTDPDTDPDPDPTPDTAAPTNTPAATADPTLATPIPGALQATAADALGLVVGDVITLGTAATATTPTSTPAIRVAIVATWLPTSPNDRHWFGESLPLSGRAGQALGPLVIVESSLATLPTSVTARWTITPTPSSNLADELPALTAAVAGLNTRLDRSEGITEQSYQLTGTLAATLTNATTTALLLRGLGAVPLTLTGLIALISLAQVTRLIGTGRAAQLALLRARGASLRSLAAHAAVEAVVAVLAGTLAGFGVVVGASAISAPGLAGEISTAADATSRLLAGLPLALGAGAVTALVCVAVAARTAALAARGRAEPAAGRTLLVATTVLALVVAGASLLQLLLYSGSAGGTLELIGAIAPALGLLALSLIALVLFRPAVALLQPLAARARGLVPALPTRQVARRASVFSVAVLAVVLTTGGATFAAVFAATWTHLGEASDHSRNGSDVRLALATQAAVAGPDAFVSAAPYAGLTGADAALPVINQAARIGDTDVSVTAFDVTGATALPGLLAGLLPGGGDSAALVAPATGTVLPADAVSVRIDVTANTPAPSATTTAPTLTAWLSDADGALVAVPATTIATTASRAATTSTATTASATAATTSFGAPLPAGSLPFTLVALQADRPTSQTAASATITVTSSTVTADGTVTALDTAGPLTLELAQGKHIVRTAAGGEAPPDALPVVLTNDLANLIGATTGDRVTALLATTGTSVDAVVVGIANTIPGSAVRYGILADLPTLDALLLAGTGSLPQPNEIWIASDHPASVADAAAALPRVDAVITLADSTSTTPGVAPAVDLLAAGAAAAALLATMTVLAVVLELEAARRGEVRLFRALGLSRRQQLGSRLAELGTVVATSIALGVCVGALVAAVTVPALAGAAISGAPSATLLVDPTVAIGAIATLAAGIVLVAAVYGLRIARTITARGAGMAPGAEDTA